MKPISAGLLKKICISCQKEYNPGEILMNISNIVNPKHQVKLFQTNLMDFDLAIGMCSKCRKEYANHTLIRSVEPWPEPDEDLNLKKHTIIDHIRNSETRLVNIS